MPKAQNSGLLDSSITRTVEEEIGTWFGTSVIESSMQSDIGSVATLDMTNVHSLDELVRILELPADLDCSSTADPHGLKESLTFATNDQWPI